MQESWYPYAANLPDSVWIEIKSSIDHAMETFQISKTCQGKELAEKVYSISEEILKTDIFPEEYQDRKAVTIELACLFAYALQTGLNWKWMEVGENPDAKYYSIVSPNEEVFIPFLHFMNKIMQKDNPGPGGNHDNTILLLYNMLEATKYPVIKKKFTLLG